MNAIKANLSACELEKNMAVERKINIFVEGKTLKAQIDELNEKVPRLQHEQGLAKETQAKSQLNGQNWEKNLRMLL